MLSAKILNWLASYDTGMSSLSIVAWMECDLTVAAMNHNEMRHPLDPADLGRCIRLLDIEPSYRQRIGEMAGVSPQWCALVAHWDELEILYREEEPSGRAPKCYARMRELLDPLREEHYGNC